MCLLWGNVCLYPLPTLNCALCLFLSLSSTSSLCILCKFLIRYAIGKRAVISLVVSLETLKFLILMKSNMPCIFKSLFKSKRVLLLKSRVHLIPCSGVEGPVTTLLAAYVSIPVSVTSRITETEAPSNFV